MDLIDKSAVVAEIERRMEELYELLPDASKVENGAITISESCNTGKYTALESFSKFLDTLEVKEVDLEKEISNYLYSHLGRPRMALEFDWKQCDIKCKADKLIAFAKHFFELGLAQSSSDEVKIGESQIYLNDDGGEPPYDGKQWLDISCMEYEIPSDKFQDGDKIEIVIRKINKGE